MNEAFRLSRIRAPRGTIAAIILLTLVFLIFGAVIISVSPEHAAVSPRYFDEHAALGYVNWMLGGWRS